MVIEILHLYFPLCYRRVLLFPVIFPAFLHFALSFAQFSRAYRVNPTGIKKGAFLGQKGPGKENFLLDSQGP